MKHLEALFERLSAFEPTMFPVVSLYLNTQPGASGGTNIDSFVRKELRRRVHAYPRRSPEHESLQRDAGRIRAWVDAELGPSSNGAVVFACWGVGEFFEALQFDAPVNEHRLCVHHQPHLFPVARLIDDYARYAVLIVGTHAARLLVCGRGALLGTGWSQMRYQRHVENDQQQATEVVNALERVVREEAIEHVLLTGDPVIVATLRGRLPHALEERVAVLELDHSASEARVLEAAIDALRKHDAQAEAEHVDRLLVAHRAGGSAVLGLHHTLAALGRHQVEELIISGALGDFHGEDVSSRMRGDDRADGLVVPADELVARARRTGARMRFIEDRSLLAAAGGVAALLRQRP